MNTLKERKVTSMLGLKVLPSVGKSCNMATLRTRFLSAFYKKVCVAYVQNLHISSMKHSQFILM